MAPFVAVFAKGSKYAEHITTYEANRSTHHSNQQVRHPPNLLLHHRFPEP
jgi:hypothetical protein